MAVRSCIPVLWLIALTLASSIFSQPAAWATKNDRGAAIQTSAGSWRGRGPAKNVWGPSGIYDPVRQRMVIFGGHAELDVVANSSNLVWELSLDGTPSWSALATIETPGPYGRQSHSAIYDPVRDRMIIFGGQGGAVFGDIWAFSLTRHNWTQITPALGPAPVPRQGHTAIYDPVRDRMIVFGGNNVSNVDQNDLWALSLDGTPTWTQITPSGTPPSVRGWHSAIYDPVRDRMVVHAGWLWATSQSIGDTWSLALSGAPAWSPLAASGSTPVRNSHSAVYDPVGDRMVVYGGWLPDLAVLSFSGSPAWSTVTPAGAGPSLRDGIAGIYDTPRQRMVIFGGIESQGSAWAVTLGASPAWSAVAPVGNPTTASRLVIRDSQRNRMVVIADEQSQSVRLWARSLSGEPGWTPLVSNGGPPPYTSSGTAIYDASRDRIVTYGGYSTDETWALNLGSLTWSKIEPPGTLPIRRSSHTAIYDQVRDRMIIYGGITGNDLHQEILALPLNGGSWYQIVPGGTQPLGRAGHTAIYDPAGDRMVICGGQVGYGTFGRDVWALNLATQTWADITPAVGLPHDAVWMSSVHDPSRQRMLMFGGKDLNRLPGNELWSLSLSTTHTWTPLNPSGVKPMGRDKPGAIWDPLRDRMVVYGGVSGMNHTDLWEYAPGATTEVPDAPLDAVNGLAFASPRPNPATGQSVHAFALARPGRVTLEVFDANGRRVRRLLDAHFAAGSHSATWSGEDDQGRTVGSGLYLMRLKCGEQERTTRVVRVH